MKRSSLARNVPGKAGAKRGRLDQPSREVEPDEEHGPEEDEDETGIFLRRAEWWRQYHGDQSGIVSGELRLQAIRHAEKLAANGLDNPDPGGDAPKIGFELTGGRGVAKAKASRGRNPRPRSSFGFASPAIDVRGPLDLGGSVLKIELDAQRMRKIEPATVRVFVLDETSREWQLVPRSGANGEAGYAWAHIERPGIYIAIGLRASSAALNAVLTLRALMPRMRAEPRKSDRRRLLKEASALLLPKNAGRKKAGAAGNGIDIAGLDIRSRGLPEFDILDEIHRPPREKHFSTISHLLWDDIRADLSGLLINGFLSEWFSVGPRNVSGRIKSLQIHPVEGNGVLAGAADGGVWRTQDGGGTWTLLAPISSNLCTRVLLHPANADILYVAGNGGLNKSTDGGASWMNVRTEHISDAVMDPISPDTIYAAVWNSGIFRTTDGGATWSDFNQGLPTGSAADWIKLAVSLRGVKGSTMLVAKMGTDSGEVFRRRIHGPPRFISLAWEAVPGTHEPASYNEWTNLVAIDPARHNVIFAGGVGLQRSTDGGANFSQVTGTHSDHHALAFARLNNDVCYMATDGGVYRSVDNGASWTLRSTGLVATQLYSIGVSQTQPFLLGGSTQDQGIIRTNGPADWSDTGAGNEGGFFIVDPRNSNNVYVTQGAANSGVNPTPPRTNHHPA